MTYRLAPALALAAIAAVACAPKASAPPGASGMVTPVAVGTGPQLTEADMPHPKAGLWEMKSAVTGVRQNCLSGQVLTVFAARPGCGQVSRQRSADGAVVMNSQCQGAGGATSTAAVSATGDGQTSLSVELAIHSAAKAEAPKIAMSDHIDYRYLGPCAAGQHPDDQP
jgi:hypothetical protein